MEAPVSIEVAGGRAVRLIWEGGEVQELDASDLRRACACATCREPQTTGRIRLQVIDPLPPTIEDARLVGSYGINFVFGPDGHRTGIFTWAQLRALSAPAAGTGSG